MAQRPLLADEREMRAITALSDCIQDFQVAVYVASRALVPQRTAVNSGRSHVHAYRSHR